MEVTSMTIRYYQDKDGAQVRQLFKESLCTGEDSPRHHLFRHELKSPRAFVSYTLFTIGIAMSAIMKALLLPAALVFIGAFLLVAHWLNTDVAFMAFVNGSVGGPDMMDVSAWYGLVESADRGQQGVLVPVGKNAFWVAEAVCVSGDTAQTEVVGCIGLDIKTSPGDDSAELRRLAVAAKYRGRGIGRQLVKVVMAHARATGVESVYLRTSSSNVGALIAYRKYGFEIEKEYDMFKKLETHILRLEVAKCLI